MGQIPELHLTQKDQDGEGMTVFPDAPKRIYLQVCSEDECPGTFDDHMPDVLWEKTRVHDRDVEYVRADILEADGDLAVDLLRFFRQWKAVYGETVPVDDVIQAVEDFSTPPLTHNETTNEDR